VELICAQLAIELGRYRACSEPEDNNTPGSLKPYQLRLIKERLNELGAPPSLAELANLCGISVRHLTRGHRVSTGQSIGDAIAEVRIKHAVNLLQTDMSIKAIALTLGFKSSASFCHVFRKAMAEPPGQYRLRFSRVRR
jgi:AraC family transcriptional regulator